MSSSNGAALAYDPLGRLYQVMLGTSTTRLLYDPGSGSGAGGDALAAEYDGAGTLTARYVHGGNAAADDPLVSYTGGTRHYLVSDHQGSIIAIADASGSAPTVNTYDEYGIPAATNQGRFQYTGQAWLPELGMYYYRARMYSPTLGRFMQTDPIGYGDGMNIYAYVRNDPVNSTDPSGLEDITITGHSWMDNVRQHLADLRRIAINQALRFIQPLTGDDPIIVRGRRLVLRGVTTSSSPHAQLISFPTGHRQCSALERALQAVGGAISSVGTDVGMIGIGVATVGTGISILGALTGDPAMAAFGAQTTTQGGVYIGAGSAIALFGALLQAAGGRPNDAMASAITDALAKRLPIGAAGRAYIQHLAEEAAKRLPQLNVCE